MKLILTADDFGRSREINAAVREAHRHGVLTAASLMVAGDAFEEAVEIARGIPTLAVGLHVVLVDGKSLLPPERLGKLVDAGGRFPDSPATLGARYFFSRAARGQVRDELEAQFARFAQTGLRLDHVDGHQHMHVHPAVFPMLIPLAQRYGAGGIRLPRDELRFALKYDRRHALTKTAWRIAMGLLSWRAARRLHGRRLAIADRVYGLMQTGRMEEKYLLALLDHLHSGSAEIYFHPTTGARTNELGPNKQEFETLMSPAVRRAIEARGARLCAYADLLEKDR